MSQGPERSAREGKFAQPVGPAAEARIHEIKKQIWRCEQELFAAVARSELVERAMNAIPLGVMICQAQTMRIAYLNDYAAQELEWALNFLGIAPTDLLGRPFSVLDSIVRIEREVLTKPYLLPRNLDMEIIGVHRPAAVLALTDPRGTYLGPLLSWPIRSPVTAPAR